jgi:hypothetical protein
MLTLRMRVQTRTRVLVLLDDSAVCMQHDMCRGIQHS